MVIIGGEFMIILFWLGVIWLANTLLIKFLDLLKNQKIRWFFSLWILGTAALLVFLCSCFFILLTMVSGILSELHICILSNAVLLVIMLVSYILFTLELKKKLPKELAFSNGRKRFAFYLRRSLFLWMLSAVLIQLLILQHLEIASVNVFVWAFLGGAVVSFAVVQWLTFGELSQRVIINGNINNTQFWERYQQYKENGYFRISGHDDPKEITRLCDFRIYSVKSKDRILSLDIDKEEAVWFTQEAEKLLENYLSENSDTEPKQKQTKKRK